MDIRQCARCNTYIEAAGNFCGVCGAPLSEAITPAPTKQVLIGGLSVMAKILFWLSGIRESDYAEVKQRAEQRRADILAETGKEGLAAWLDYFQQTVDYDDPLRDPDGPSIYGLACATFKFVKNRSWEDRARWKEGRELLQANMFTLWELLIPILLVAGIVVAYFSSSWLYGVIHPLPPAVGLLLICVCLLGLGFLLNSPVIIASWRSKCESGESALKDERAKLLLQLARKAVFIRHLEYGGIAVLATPMVYMLFHINDGRGAALLAVILIVVCAICISIWLAVLRIWLLVVTRQYVKLLLLECMVEVMARLPRKPGSVPNDAAIPQVDGGGR